MSTGSLFYLWDYFFEPVDHVAQLFHAGRVGHSPVPFQFIPSRMTSRVHLLLRDLREVRNNDRIDRPVAVEDRSDSAMRRERKRITLRKVTREAEDTSQWLGVCFGDL